MSVRIYVLAKELGVSSKDLLDKLSAMEISVKGHMSSLEDELVERVRRQFAAPAAVEAKPAAPRPIPAVEPPLPPPAPLPVAVPDKSPLSDLKKKPIAARPEKKSPEAPAPKPIKKAVPPPVKKEIGSAPAPAAEKPVVPAQPRNLTIPMPLSVKEFCGRINVPAAEVIKRLMKMGIMATLNQSLEEETVKLVGLELGWELQREPTDEEKLLAAHTQVHEIDLEPRSPVVTFMGHVDHGKTSLLDAIRKTNVVGRESGGITQHIGAYEVSFKKGSITFLDTPGHQAFTAMRARGANITDIVVIIVAADDGVMPQTVEAIDHAKAAGAPIVVAINKVDLPTANIERVRRQLSEIGLLCEEWGGKTITACVSARSGEGIEHLLDMLLLEAEMLELRASRKKPAEGVVIESRLSRGSGPTATILVQNGILRQSDFFVCGLTFGKIRAMTDDAGRRIALAGPSCPVEILGLSQVPQVGDKFYVVEDERKAREICERKSEEMRQQRLMPAQRMSLDQLFEKAKQGEVKELKIILKADVQGSLEALGASLRELSTSDIAVNIIHAQVGSITDSDIMLAVASDAVVIGFHVNVETSAREEADRRGVDVRLYKIIYDVINEVRLSMEGFLEPTLKETVLGKAKVQQVFKISNLGKIAGCIVVKGKFMRSADLVRVFREGNQIFEGKLQTLKRYKDDVKEVSEGVECGIDLVNFSDYQPEDIIENIRVEKVMRKL
ncbi:MAG: translation initiation factor IF-2 [Candidatus Omnitrophica bacterium]|nr:translation initiation factor IF-2 [Candidatus Omnitrophota bacterium]